jgi:serine/threonine protein kinase
MVRPSSGLIDAAASLIPEVTLVPYREAGRAASLAAIEGQMMQLSEQLEPLDALEANERAAAGSLLRVLSARRSDLSEQTEILTGHLSCLMQKAAAEPLPSPAEDVFRPEEPSEPQAEPTLYTPRQQLLATTPPHVWGSLAAPVTLLGRVDLTSSLFPPPPPLLGTLARLEIEGYVMYLSEPFAGGSFGAVSYGLDARGNTLAVKRVPLADMAACAAVYQEMQAMHLFAQELRPMRALEHEGALYLPMPLLNADGMDLLSSPGLTNGERASVVLSMLYDCLPILGAMHGASDAAEWSHRDIKPENIFFDIRGKAWLADFGMACPQGQEIDKTSGPCGTFYYLAPETCFPFRDQPFCGQAADVWSLGMTLLNGASNLSLFMVLTRGFSDKECQTAAAYAAAVCAFAAWRRTYALGTSVDVDLAAILAGARAPIHPISCLVHIVHETLGTDLTELVLNRMLSPDPARRLGFAQLAAHLAEMNEGAGPHLPHGAAWRPVLIDLLKRVTATKGSRIAHVAHVLADRHLEEAAGAPNSAQNGRSNLYLRNGRHHIARQQVPPPHQAGALGPGHGTAGGGRTGHVRSL